MQSTNPNLRRLATPTAPVGVGIEGRLLNQAQDAHERGHQWLAALANRKAHEAARRRRQAPWMATAAKNTGKRIF